MKVCVSTRMVILVGLLLTIPFFSQAQGFSGSVYSLHSVLEHIMKDMLPLCRRMIDVGRALAGLGALVYISVRVWKHIAKAEPIDFFPLFRPFAIGLVILFYAELIGLLNGVLQPVSDATAEMSKDSRKAIEWNIEQQEKALKNPPETGTFSPGDPDMDKYSEPGASGEKKGFFSTLSNAFSAFNIKKMIVTFITEVVQTLYSAASLCINTIRTFYLIVLAILGPLALGLSVFDGFQQTLASWLARYINISMWLPVANIFGAISSKILENVIIRDPDFFSSIGYAVFMIISIVGYTTVPNVASYIVEAGGKDTLLHKVTNMTAAAGKAVAASI